MTKKMIKTQENNSSLNKATQDERLRQVTKQWGTAAYYDRVLKRRAEGKDTWNWGAFFFGELWLIMHKMYTKAILWFFIFFGFVVLHLLAGVELYKQQNLNFKIYFTIPYVYVLVQSLIFGRYGNRWLFKDINNKLDKGADPSKRPFVNNALPLIFSTHFYVIGARLPWDKAAEAIGEATHSWYAYYLFSIVIHMVTYFWSLVVLWVLHKRERRILQKGRLEESLR